MNMLSNRIAKTSPLEIRLATIDDVESMTNLHCRSFLPEEQVPMALGRNYVRATYRWLVTNKKSYALVAGCEGKVIGLVGMCDRSFTLPMFLACLPDFFQSILKNPSLLTNIRLWRRFSRSPIVTNKHSKFIADYPAVAQMTIGAVDSSYRGMNIFPRLISSTKELSKARGTRAILAGIYKTNKPSRRAFIKDDWHETPELETSETVFYMAFLDEKIAGELKLEHLLNACQP
jgi:hypothetical protein